MLCPGDGIGRHARLKIWWLHGRMGSSPIPGSKNYYFEKNLLKQYKKLVNHWFEVIESN